MERMRKTYASLAAAAVALPIVMFGAAAAGSKLNFLSRAQQAVPLRLWWEPAEVTIRPGQKFRLSLVAEYKDKIRLGPQVKARVLARPAGLVVKPERVAYTQAFVGRVEVGTVEVEAMAAGVYRVETQLDGLPVVTSPATVYVR